MVSFLQGLVAGDVFFDNFFVSGNPTPQNQLFEISIPAIQVQNLPFEGPVILTWRIIPFGKNS